MNDRYVRQKTQCLKTQPGCGSIPGPKTPVNAKMDAAITTGVAIVAIAGLKRWRNEE